MHLRWRYGRLGAADACPPNILRSGPCAYLPGRVKLGTRAPLAPPAMIGVAVIAAGLECQGLARLRCSRFRSTVLRSEHRSSFGGGTRPFSSRSSTKMGVRARSKEPERSVAAAMSIRTAERVAQLWLGLPAVTHRSTRRDFSGWR
jgi:hypothetical protein